MDGPTTPDPDATEVAEQVLGFDPARLREALHGRSTPSGGLLAVGVAASPGAASGPVATSFDAALDAADRGESPVLVLEETGPADEPAMRVAAAVVTVRGGLASHAAVVARGWGLPAVCGVSVARIEAGAVRFGDVRVDDGEWVSVDGSSGELRSGVGRHVAATGLDEELDELLGWCDRLVGGRPQVWVNADTPEEVRAGMALGALGVGLCRTEHQFLGGDLGLLRTLLLGGRDAEQASADLAEHQRAAVLELLDAAAGVPVVVRLLDPPLHEFLPAPDDERADPELRRLAGDWREHDPMLGVRGVRLAVAAPELVAAQVRGLLAALADRQHAGIPSDLRLLVPMVSWPAELELALDVVRSAAASASVPVPPVGVMVETPAAALGAHRLAAHAAFLSVGTNDLSQLTLGLGRDDTEARVVEAYRSRGMLAASPFATLDDTVADLVAGAVRRAPDSSWGLCGEHAGDPVSLRRLAEVPFHSVSCSAYRVPVARLELGRIAAARLLGVQLDDVPLGGVPVAGGGD